MMLVWKLLRENISKIQLFGFAIANLIGLSILLLAIQFYVDVSPIFTQKDELFKKDYLTISKKINLISGLSSKSNSFSDAEINDLKIQPFVKNVGVFTSSQFSVFAGFNNPTMNIGFNTEMFFESVPDNFIDVKTDEWHFSPLDQQVPIILPKSYLDLYNFGFAESKSMPKLTEGLIGMVNLDITLYGKNSQPKHMKGRIVGFSNRINTILVPQSFMTWANKEFEGGKGTSPARLIVEVNNIADPNLSKYFKDNGYEIGGDSTTASKMAFLLKIIVAIVVFVGVIICLLAFFVLILSIYLILEKNMHKLRNLRLIGYKKSYVVRPYELLVVILNLTILIISLVIVVLIRDQYLSTIEKIFSLKDLSSPLLIISIGAIIFVLLSLFNIINIRNKVK